MDFKTAWMDIVAGVKLRIRAVRALPWTARAAIVAGLVAAVLAYETPIWDAILAWWKTVTPPKTAESVSAIVRNLGFLVAGGLGLWLAFARTRVAQQGHITDRFSKAVEQLGHKNVSVRIGGLYALKRIAEDSPERDHLAVMDVVSNFIRYPPYGHQQRATAKSVERALQTFTDTGGGTAEPGEEAALPETFDCPDVIAAIEIVRRKTARQKRVELERGYDVSLHGANLRYLRLERVNLGGLDCGYADFTGANLRHARFTDAILFLAQFRSANLMGAHLTGANLGGAKLEGANLSFSDLIGADLKFADLAGADLTVVDFTGADLMGANLADVDLANTRGVTQGQLDSASGTGTLSGLPVGLTVPERGSPED